ncbi:putative transmembrane and TPR repeat-containing protein 2-like [Scophthalmus maximus]|uniref:Putative transmembrane and TPR repeat-containing protein 2-like n=1 Tax=Scophthalmus maximus TaxID=52904 RepID=A0A2U9BY67_SCOMX|nr:putative transmembrane and TPR repeat-containing protein 2-like [Scophthalmus maximus]
MFAEVLCGAVALLLYVNTLGADFCYDDRVKLECTRNEKPITAWRHILLYRRCVQRLNINVSKGHEEVTVNAKRKKVNTCYKTFYPP